MILSVLVLGGPPGYSATELREFKGKTMKSVQKLTVGLQGLRIVYTNYKSVAD